MSYTIIHDLQLFLQRLGYDTAMILNGQLQGCQMGNAGQILPWMTMRQIHGRGLTSVQLPSVPYAKENNVRDVRCVTMLSHCGSIWQLGGKSAGCSTWREGGLGGIWMQHVSYIYCILIKKKKRTYRRYWLYLGINTQQHPWTIHGPRENMNTAGFHFILPVVNASSSGRGRGRSGWSIGAWDERFSHEKYGFWCLSLCIRQGLPTLDEPASWPRCERTNLLSVNMQKVGSTHSVRETYLTSPYNIEPCS